MLEEKCMHQRRKDTRKNITIFLAFMAMSVKEIEKLEKELQLTKKGKAFV